MPRLLAALIALLAASCSHPQAADRVLSVCELSADYPAYDSKMVAVRGVYFHGLRQDCGRTCAAGPWPSFLDLKHSDPLPGEAPVGFQTDQASWRAIETAARAAAREAGRGNRVEVWLTVTGQLRSHRRSPLGPCDKAVWGAYGHLGAYPAEIVVKNVSNIQLVPNPRSPYDYSKIHR